MIPVPTVQVFRARSSSPAMSSRSISHRSESVYSLSLAKGVPDQAGDVHRVAVVAAGDLRPSSMLSQKRKATGTESSKSRTVASAASSNDETRTSLSYSLTRSSARSVYGRHSSRCVDSVWSDSDSANARSSLPGFLNAVDSDARWNRVHDGLKRRDRFFGPQDSRVGHSIRVGLANEALGVCQLALAAVAFGQPVVVEGDERAIGGRHDIDFDHVGAPVGRLRSRSAERSGLDGQTVFSGYTPANPR